MDGDTTGWLHQQDLFVAGVGGYHTYRIPALIASVQGTLLAFCEGRLHGQGDAGEIGILLRRSNDRGNTWGEVQIVVAEANMTCGNPCPTLNASDGTIWLPFCKNLGAGAEDLIIRGQAPRTVWLTHSHDEGRTWAEPSEITASTKNPSWTWCATGPGHGIQLSSGRLVVPCDHMRAADPPDGNISYQELAHSHLLYSDDHGLTWRIGAVAQEGTNECELAQVADGGLYVSSRNYRGARRRAYAWSRDGGLTFSEQGWDEALREPICQASLACYPGAGGPGRHGVLFSNPASTEREQLTVRMSTDDCRTWGVARVLHAGPSAYSDLAVISEGTICCLYECGTDHPYERLTLARFDLAWLTA